MYFKVIENFDKKDDTAWLNYVKWRTLELDKFDSVDGMLRPDIFEPKSSADWDNCVNSDYKINLITNIEYATKIKEQHPKGVLVGVEIELKKDVDSKEGLLGYDVIDEYCVTSLLTNWGNDTDFINKAIMSNGLLGSFSEAISIRDKLHSDYKEDSHACNCSIWAVYEISY